MPSLEVWFEGVDDFWLSLNIPLVSWSQANGETSFSTRSLAAPLGLFSCIVNPGLYRTRKNVNYIGHFIRHDRPGTFSTNLWSTCVKLWLWMLAQKLDSIRSPFSNQFSKVDILQNSKKKTEKLLAWKGCHNEPGDIRMNTRPLANEAVSIYNLNWLDWKRINPGWHTWTSVTVTCLPQL